jgi:hypothetical protein
MPSAEYQTALASFVSEHSIEAIIQDSYTSAMLGKGLDANQPDFAALAQMLGQLDALVLGIAHANKAASVHGRQPRVSDVAYTQALGALAQTVIVVHYPDPEDRHHIHVGCARSPEQDFKGFVVRFTDAIGLGSPLKVAVVPDGREGPSARERKHAATVEKRANTIERVLQQGNGGALVPMSVSKVRASACMNGDAFNEALTLCEARGSVSRELSGKLCFVPEAGRKRRRQGT